MLMGCGMEFSKKREIIWYPWAYLDYSDRFLPEYGKLLLIHYETNRNAKNIVAAAYYYKEDGFKLLHSKNCSPCNFDEDPIKRVNYWAYFPMPEDLKLFD
jgi:hypothetical protein